MTREELLSSPEYWSTNIQQDLYTLVYEYMDKTGETKQDIAKKLGISSASLSNFLTGRHDHRLSKLIKVLLALNKIPVITYVDLDKYIKNEKTNQL